MTKLFEEKKFNIGELKGISKKTIEEHLKLYADVDQLTEKSVFHAGTEIGLWENAFDLRGGVSQKTGKGDELIYALGFGVKIRTIELNYAFESHFDLGGSHIASVNLKF